MRQEFELSMRLKPKPNVNVTNMIELKNLKNEKYRTCLFERISIEQNK